MVTFKEHSNVEARVLFDNQHHLLPIVRGEPSLNLYDDAVVKDNIRCVLVYGSWHCIQQHFRLVPVPYLSLVQLLAYLLLQP